MILSECIVCSRMRTRTDTGQQGNKRKSRRKLNNRDREAIAVFGWLPVEWPTTCNGSCSAVCPLCFDTWVRSRILTSPIAPIRRDEVKENEAGSAAASGSSSSSGARLLAADADVELRITCPAQGCALRWNAGATMSMDDVRNNVSARTRAEIDAVLARARLSASPDFIPCPACPSGGFRSGGECESKAACPECEHAFLTAPTTTAASAPAGSTVAAIAASVASSLREKKRGGANMPSRAPLPRDESLQTSALFGALRVAVGAEDRRQLQMAADEAYLQQRTMRCPKCRACVSRNMGCTSMTCRCGANFTWTAPGDDQFALIRQNVGNRFAPARTADVGAHASRNQRGTFAVGGMSALCAVVAVMCLAVASRVFAAAFAALEPHARGLLLHREVTLENWSAVHRYQPAILAVLTYVCDMGNRVYLARQRMRQSTAAYKLALKRGGWLTGRHLGALRPWVLAMASVEIRHWLESPFVAVGVAVFYIAALHLLAVLVIALHGLSCFARAATSPVYALAMWPLRALLTIGADLPRSPVGAWLYSSAHAIAHASEFSLADIETAPRALASHVTLAATQVAIALGGIKGNATVGV